MGNNLNGKRDEQKKTYYQQQINLFKWRADPKHNAFLPRVYFCKKSQQLQRQRFRKIPLRQLEEQFFIDMKQISKLVLEDERQPVQGDIIVFEKYASKLSIFNHSLTLQECLYVLNSLLEGYQRIFNKMGKTHIENEFCFVTMEGQVRAWFNENPTSNQFPREQILFNGYHNQFKEMKKFFLFNGEAGIIKKLVDLNYELSNHSQEYLQFFNKLQQFLNGNILHHTNFNAVRKFINKYVFNFRIILPFNLHQAFKRLKSLKHYRETSLNSQGNSSEQLNMTSVQLSTNINLQYSKQPEEQIEQEDSQSIRRQKSFKGENAQINENFAFGCKTQKTNKSTYIHSQIQSRYQKENTHTISFQKPKGFQKNKTFSNLRYFQEPSKALKKSEKQINSKSAKISVKFHSRQPSMQQQTNSMFISPVNEGTDCGIHYSYAPQSQNYPNASNNVESMMSIYKKQVQCPNNNDKIKSNMLSRQVSGLVSNKSLSICQSIGTFQSIDGSKDSGYRGVLLKMGKTAKLLNQTTNKNFNNSFKGNTFDAYMTN